MAAYKLMLSTDSFQTFTTTINGIQYRLTLRYFPRAQQWSIDCFNVADQRWVCQGQALALGVPILLEAGEEIVFIVSDNSSLAIDPALDTDMSGRITLWIADNDEETLRAFVPA